MINLKKGENTIKAKANISIASSGLTVDNCEIVFQLGKQPISYRPGSELNALSDFTKGEQYLIRVKEDVQISKL